MDWLFLLVPWIPISRYGDFCANDNDTTDCFSPCACTRGDYLKLFPWPRSSANCLLQRKIFCSISSLNKQETSKLCSYSTCMYKGYSNMFCLSISTKISRSEDLGIWATREHSKSSKDWFHYSSIRLARPTSITNAAFFWPRLSSLPTAGYVLSTCAHNSTTSIGKDRLLCRRMFATCMLYLSFLYMYMYI